MTSWDALRLSLAVGVYGSAFSVALWMLYQAMTER